MFAPHHINSAELRADSRRLAFRSKSAVAEICRISDDSVQACTSSRRLLAEARRVREPLRRPEIDYPIRPAHFETPQLLDCEIFDDPDLLAEINSAKLDCEKCGQAGYLVAVARFRSLEQVFAVCGDCFRQLNELSLGAVV